MEKSCKNFNGREIIMAKKKYTFIRFYRFDKQSDKNITINIEKNSIFATSNGKNELTEPFINV